MNNDKSHVKDCVKYIDNFERFFVIFFDIPGYLPFNNIPLQNHSLIAQYRNKLAKTGNLHGLHSVIHVTTKRDIKQELTHAKTLDIILPFIDYFSVKDDIVLDLFLGSGSVLIASEKLGRTCFGMELDCHNVDVIIKRWIDYTGGTAKVDRSGSLLDYESLKESG